MTKLDDCFQKCHIYLAIVSWNEPKYGSSYTEITLE